MSNECATLIELLRFEPLFGAVGSKTFGTLTISAQPIAGDSFRILDPYSIPPSAITLIAGTDFDIGVDVDETATNLAAELEGLVIGGAIDNVITIVSVASGAAALYTWTSDFGTLDPVDGLGTGAAPGPVTIALESACNQIEITTCYKDKAKAASLYLAAHYLGLQTGIGATGTVSKRKIKDLETQYNVPGVPSDKDLGSTKFGRMLITLKKTVFVPPLVGRSGSRCR
jgi:hypothetical protein